MPWLIKKEVDDGRGIVLATVASDTDTPNDEFTFQLSLFRGPNKLIWRHRSITRGTALDLNTSTRIFFVGKYKGETRWHMELSIQSIMWDKDQSMVITLIPTLHAACDTYQEIVNTKAKKMEDVFLYLLPVGTTVALSEDIVSADLYNGFAIKGTIKDAIAEMADRFKCEFYMSDQYFGFGKIINYNVGNLENNTNAYNTMSRIKIGNKFFHTFTLDHIENYPGQLIKFEKKYHRIVYAKIYYGPVPVTQMKSTDKKTSSALEYTVVCTDMEDDITERELARLLPDLEREILLLKMAVMNHRSSYIAHNVTDDDEFDILSLTDSDKRDMSSLTNKFNSTGLTRTVRTSPFAAPYVGLQFPTTPDSYDVVVTDGATRATSMVVGQVWQKGKKDDSGVDVVPVRGSIEDMRWTFSDGSTIYWDKAEECIRIMAKAKLILGIDTTIDHATEPGSFESGIEFDVNGATQSYKELTIEATGGNIVFNVPTGSTVQAGGTADVPNMDHQHSVLHTHLCMPPGSPTVVASDIYIPTSESPQHLSAVVADTIVGGIGKFLKLHGG